jgi:hypothetical protein
VRSGLAFQQAFDALKRFYSAETVDVSIYVFFSGLHGRKFEQSPSYEHYSFGSPFSEDELVSGRLFARREVGLGTDDIYIVTKAECPIQFGERSGINQSLAYDHILDPLSAHLRLIETDGRTPLYPISYYLKFDESVSPLPLIFDKTQRLAGGREWVVARNNDHVGGRELVELWTKFDGLHEQTRSRLQIPLRWISRSLREPEAIDAMIAVGIALESLFLDRDISEQATYRLSLTGSLWLEGAVHKRRETEKLLKEVYRHRSKSVHGVKTAIDPSMIESGRELAARGVSLVLQRGFIPESWTDWIMNGAPSVLERRD